MEDFVKQIAEKLGVGEDEAHGIAKALHGDGHDLQSLLADGDFLSKAQNLLGEQGQHLLNGIPGIGGMLGGFMESDKSLEPSSEPPVDNNE